MIRDDVKLGKDVRIPMPDLVNLYGCEVGDGTKIGPFVEIQKGAKVGKNCKISSHTFVCGGVTIGDDCFVGHGVMFINDRYPRSVTDDGKLKTDADWKCEEIHVGKGAGIGSNATIMCGVKIGANAMIGAGAVVIKDVPANATAVGNPARILQPKKNRKRRET